jgi:hypothetical protein
MKNGWVFPLLGAVQTAERDDLLKAKWFAGRDRHRCLLVCCEAFMRTAGYQRRVFPVRGRFQKGSNIVPKPSLTFRFKPPISLSA